MTRDTKGRLATASLLAGVLGMLLTFGYANGFDSIKDSATVLITTIVFVAADVYRSKQA